MNSQQEDLVQKRQVQERCDYEVKRRESPRFGSPGGHFFDFIEKTMPPSLLFPMSGKKAVTRLAKGSAASTSCRGGMPEHLVERSPILKRAVDVMLDSIDQSQNGRLAMAQS